MFQVLYRREDGTNFVQECMDEKSKNSFVNILTNAGIECQILERPVERKFQLCKCMFRADDKIEYSFVCPDNNARVGDLADAICEDSFGEKYTKRVFIRSVSKVTTSEIKRLANSLGRDKLGTIKVA